MNSNHMDQKLLKQKIYEVLLKTEKNLPEYFVALPTAEIPHLEVKKLYGTPFKDREARLEVAALFKDYLKTAFPNLNSTVISLLIGYSTDVVAKTGQDMTAVYHLCDFLELVWKVCELEPFSDDGGERAFLSTYSSRKEFKWTDIEDLLQTSIDVTARAAEYGTVYDYYNQLLNALNFVVRKTKAERFWDKHFTMPYFCIRSKVVRRHYTENVMPKNLLP